MQGVERRPGRRLHVHGVFLRQHRGLGHATWRHVKFVERGAAPGAAADGGYRSNAFRWDFSSDVCKHCEHAGCLEACPTGSIVRTEFGGVFIQPDVCNGCGYCVVACPFGVVERRPDDGRAFKCTFCYDRQKAGLQPACATACPTQSILFGEIDDLRRRGEARLATLRERGIEDAQLYDPRDSSVGGTHAMFIFRGDPADYNLPATPGPAVSASRRRLARRGGGGGFDACRDRAGLQLDRAPAFSRGNDGHATPGRAMVKWMLAAAGLILAASVSTACIRRCATARRRQ